jgi:hypothetical protein
MTVLSVICAVFQRRQWMEGTYYFFAKDQNKQLGAVESYQPRYSDCNGCDGRELTAFGFLFRSLLADA